MVKRFFLAIALLSSCGSNDHTLTPADKATMQNEINQIIAVSPHDYVFKNVQLISMENESLQTGKNVYVKNGLIEKIAGAGESTDGYVTIDGTGKYLMPGLTDMHVHFVTDSLYDQNNLFIMLANGVTRMRIMWGFRAHIKLRDKINKGQLLGPSMVVASSGFNGTSPIWPGTITTNTTDEVREYVDAYHDLAFDYIKIYSYIPQDQYDALLNAAKGYGMKAFGHLPETVDFEYAMNHGQYSIEHLGGFSRFAIGSAGFSSSVTTSIKNGTWHCPTLTVLTRVTSGIDQYKRDEYYSMLSPGVIDWFNGSQSQPLPFDPAPGHAQRKQMVKALHDAGVNLIGGTDAGIRYIIPGPSLHEELQFNVDAGLSNYQALKLVTVNPANFINDNFGRIIAGQEADLVLLDKNPFDNIANAKTITGVMKAGTWLSKENIDKVKDRLKKVY